MSWGEMGDGAKLKNSTHLFRQDKERKYLVLIIFSFCFHIPVLLFISVWVAGPLFPTAWSSESKIEKPSNTRYFRRFFFFFVYFNHVITWNGRWWNKIIGFNNLIIPSRVYIGCPFLQKKMGDGRNGRQWFNVVKC